MSFLKRKNKHVYKDFGVYCECSYLGVNYKYPYELLLKRAFVCTKCKCREDVEMGRFHYLTESDMNERVNILVDEIGLQESYKVENAIQGFIYLESKD